MPTIDVRCSGSAESGWTCAVDIGDEGRTVTSHEVRVRDEDLGRLAPAAADPTELVRASFAFLLERESPRSILRSFDLLEIARYFPEYEATIRGRR
jgi:hypothetical protein